MDKTYKLNNQEITEIRNLYLLFLTEDIDIDNQKSKQYNQAIFDKDKGKQMFCETDLNMVMEKFDKAIKVYNKAHRFNIKI